MDSTPDCKHTGGTRRAATSRAASSGAPPLATLIAREIEAAPARAITFARFMELALYHPQHGYYNRSENIIGKSGDFFTSVSVGSLFGEMLAFWLSEEFKKMDGPVQIVESGAHDGTLARDILKSIRKDVDYFIVEPSDVLQKRQREKLADFSNVKWFREVEALPAIHGAFICNELLDAFPVHVFRWNKRDSIWEENGVALADEDFVWKPIHEPNEWPDYLLKDFAPLLEYLPDQFTVEFSPTAERWWRGATRRLERGAMLAIDYGGETADLFNAERTNGTLRAFRNHRQSPNVLSDPGEQDITASVNFSILRAVGDEIGMISDPLQTQSSFLGKIATRFFAKNVDPKQVRQFQTLTHPDHLGHKFKVFVQRA